MRWYNPESPSSDSKNTFRVKEERVSSEGKDRRLSQPSLFVEMKAKEYYALGQPS